MTNLLTRRVEATQAVLDEWRGKPFVWGGHDCARLAAAMMNALGWSVGLSRFGYYKTAVGAAKALRRKGFADLAGVMDTLGPFPIPYASALPGDVVGFAHSDQPMGVGLAVTIGNGRVLGFMDNGDGAGPCCHVYPPVLTAQGARFHAWRVDPR